MASQAPAQPRPYTQAYLPNGAAPGAPAPGATPLLPNQGRVIQSGNTRILCIADVRGNLRSFNDLAAEARANCIIHTGDFGFYDERSLDRIAEKTLKHVAQYSPLLSDHMKRQIAASPPNQPIKDRFPRDQLPLSELPEFLNKKYTLNVPVYTVWGACEDVQVLEKLRSGEYKVDNLHIIDEAHSRLLEVGGVKLRLLGLGGAVVMHKLFDNGEGRTTIAGGQGTMWTTLLQMGELVDTASRVYDPTETRIFVTHASPAREGLLNQLSVTLKADFSISAGLHFRYGSSYNEFSVNPTLDHYRGKLAASKASFNDVWETVKGEVEPAVLENEPQQRLLHAALDIVAKMPSVANGGNPFGGQAGGPGSGQVDESAFKNMWNFNLADAAYGWLVLDIDNGRIGTEMRAQGFNFAHRGGKVAPQHQQAAPVAPATNTGAPTGGNLPTSSAQPSPAQGRTPTVPVTMPQPAQQPRPQPGPSASTPPVAQQQQPPPPQQQQQQQQARAQAPQSAPTGSSASVPPREPVKPATPQPPITTTTNTTAHLDVASDKPASNESKTNGTAGANSAKPAESAAPRTETPVATEQKPSQALFVRNCKDEDQVRGLVAEEDKPKIDRVEKRGIHWVVHFGSPEDMQAALTRVSNEYKFGKNQEGKPNVREYKPPGERGDRRPYGGPGQWGNSTRGGAQSGGYRSGGASDSEGGRGGRGGFRGRGNARGGERGRGRGGRGGAGLGKSEGAGAAGSSPAAAGNDS